MARSRAVIFAVNDYAPVGPGGSDLQGCVADAEDMANTLHILGFPKSKIRVYTDKRATVRRMKAQLEWLIKDSRPGDRLVFYYSGHGSQVPDIDLDGVEDFEADEQDEILVLHDHDWEGNFISDDDFAEVLSKAHPTVNLDVIMDCCFSGSATRSIVNPLVGAFSVAGEKPETKRPRYMSPPIDFAFHLSRAVTSRNPIVETTKDSNHTLWSACQEYQVSMEYLIDGRVRGAFTYNFCKILRASKGEDNRALVYTTLRDAMSRSGDEQVPRIDSNPRMLSQKPFRKGSVVVNPFRKGTPAEVTLRDKMSKTDLSGGTMPHLYDIEGNNVSGQNLITVSTGNPAKKPKKRVRKMNSKKIYSNQAKRRRSSRNMKHQR